MAAAGLLLVLALGSCAPSGRAIVTEVHYDAIGDDTGREFVEFLNPTDQPVALAGVRLESGDGSLAGRWTTRWTGGVHDTVGTRARFVVGGALVVPVPEAIATLELQNGPDALRVTWPDGVQELVGWGVQEFTEYACGTSAVDVAPGQSLARVPDEADLGSNALDFRAAPPSPGRANQPGADLALVPGSLGLAPEAPGPAGTVRVHAQVANAGREDLLAGSATLTFDGDALLAGTVLALPAIASGESLHANCSLVAGGAGKRELRASLAWARDAVSGNDSLAVRARVGDGPLELTEVQFHPASGEGEWVELRNRSPEPVALALFTLADRSEVPGRIAAPASLPPESLAVLAQDLPAFRRAFPGLDTLRVVAASPWASLNNGNDSTGVADIVTLRETDGLLVERFAYSSAGLPAGVPLERRDGEWGPASGAPGTPLAFPRFDRVTDLEFEVAPRRLQAGGEAVRLAWRLPWPRARVTIELFDLEGRRAAVLLNDFASTMSGEQRVRVDGAPPGLYVAQLRARTEREVRTRTALLRIARAAS